MFGGHDIAPIFVWICIFPISDSMGATTRLLNGRIMEYYSNPTPEYEKPFRNSIMSSEITRDPTYPHQILFKGSVGSCARFQAFSGAIIARA